MSTAHDELESIFAAAIDLPRAEVYAYISGACGNNTELLQQVTRLVQAHRKNATGWLDSPPIGLTSIGSPISDVAEQVGDVIGRFKLIKKLGEGGMGVVYLAEQVEGIQRQVALKIVKLGMDTRQVLARFALERQSLSRFNHPNIARVFDAGVTATGRPFFVMESVDGVGIAKYFRQHHPPLDARLRLFIDVCLAVHHAHQKGIIHRDLKPSNILIDTGGPEPVAKVIDFGIAKAIRADPLSDHTLGTSCTALIGTPSYMSPEQASPTAEPVDIRSDVYSLGVILYELLTGTTPSSRGDNSAIPNATRDETIEPPSVRLARPQTAQNMPFEEATSRAQLMFRKELDWISMKALALQRDDRYPSASEFANDLERFLADEPVIAAPPAKFYKLKNFARRNRIAIVTAMVMMASLMMLTAACAYFAISASRARNELSVAYDKHRYESCFAIAAEKFEDEHYDKFEVLEDELYRDWAASLAEQGTPVKKSLVSNCPFFYYERIALLELSANRELIPAFQMLKKWHEREEFIFERTYRDSDFAQSIQQHVHTKQCHDYHRRYRDAFVDFRCEFYRLVLEEHENAFGVDSPKIADALNLLALSLADAGKVDEAKEYLGSSSAIGDASNAKVVSQLLTTLSSEPGK